VRGHDGLLYCVGAAIDEGVEPLAKLSAMAKLICGDTAMAVTTDGFRSSAATAT
jgi:alkylation response protein AidB-like acyl-CoA dehydrogenase